MWLKSIQIPSQGINIPSRLMALKDVLVVKFANKQDIKQWDVVTHSKTKSSRILEKCGVFRAEGVRKHG